MNETEKLKKLSKRTDAAIEALKAQRLRWVMGVSHVGIKIDDDRYRAVLDNIMKDEIERQMIISTIKERGPSTIKELSETTDISPDRILRHIIALRKAGTISEVGEKEHGYLYTVV